MKVEIWSDVTCPFCYIGKRRFEMALEQLPGKDDIEVTWKSFHLNPAMKTEPGKNINHYLSEIKGWLIAEAKRTNEYVTQMARKVGLNYDFDRAVVASSFDAHRVAQLAKANGKGDAMEEQLFKTYFTEGKNNADHNTLVQLAVSVGIGEDAVKDVLKSEEYADAVESDIHEAHQIGVRGVPYFGLNDRYAVSGAQTTETFLGALNKAWGEWEKERPLLQDLNSDTPDLCTTEGDCN